MFILVVEAQKMEAVIRKWGNSLGIRIPNLDWTKRKAAFVPGRQNAS
jgi:hypothetical protein